MLLLLLSYGASFDKDGRRSSFLVFPVARVVVVVVGWTDFNGEFFVPCRYRIEIDFWAKNFRFSIDPDLAKKGDR